MKFALEVWSPSFEQVASTCVLADSLGLDGFYYGESPNSLNLDCWSTLAALARSTKQIRLGPVITNVLPTYRSNILLAKQASTVAEISHNRLDFRTGVGASTKFGGPWWEPFGVRYPDYDQRLADLAEALAVLPRLWVDEQIRPPVTVAATGKRAMELAAAHADVWETSFCTPTEFAERSAAMDEVVQGRTIERSLEIDGFISTTKDGLSQLMEQVRADRGGTENLTPILERALVGRPLEAVDHVRELARLGVDQLVVALHDPHSSDAITALAEIASIHRQT